MSEILLAGHHVKNLYYAVRYRKRNKRYVGSSGNSFEHILDNPKREVRINAGSIDSICEECIDLSKCLDEGNIYGRDPKFYDWLVARAYGTKVGETYSALELMEHLGKRNRQISFIKFILADAFVSIIGFPVRLLDKIKPLEKR